jgi:hypothetical protein
MKAIWWSLTPGICVLAALAASPCQAALDYYGNCFEVTATKQMGAIDASTKKASLRFTAQGSRALAAFRIYLSTCQSGSKTYRYGIQQDAGGLPTGAWLAHRDLTASSTGWLTVTLTSTINLTAGQVYHLVVEPVDTPNKTINLRATTPLNHTIVYDQNSDSNSNTLFYNGSTWTVQDNQPIYFLDYLGGTHEGNPCSSAGYGSIYGLVWESEKFTVAGADRSITEVGVFLRREGAPPNDCNFVLRDLTDATDLASGKIAGAAEVTTSYEWYTYHLPAPLTLAGGKQYRIYLKTVGGDVANRYQWCMPYNLDAAEYDSRNYDGAGSINETSSDGGLTWPDGWPNYDGVFRFTLYALSITVDPASVDLGVIPPGTTDVISRTPVPGGSIVVANSGSINVRYQLQLENPTGWAAVAGPPSNRDEYRLSGVFHPDQAEASDFERTGPAYNDVLGTLVKTCDGIYLATGANQDGYDVAPADTQNLYLDFDAPPSTGVSSQQTIRVIITAQPMP